MFSTHLCKGDPAPLRLTPEQTAAFERDGFLHLPDVFAAAEIQAIRDRLAALDKANAGIREDLDGGFFSRRGLTLEDAELAGLACDGRLLGPAVQLLGPRLRLVGVQSIRREPLVGQPAARTPQRHGWHRDIYGMSRDLGTAVPRCAVKCALWLSPALDESDGGTRFLPGSQEHARIEIEPGEMDPRGWVSPPTRVGDVVIFENRTFHAGGVNRSDHAVHMLLIQYGYRWLAPVIARRHAATVIEACGGLARQLLEPDECLGDCYRPGSGAQEIEAWARALGLGFGDGR